MSYLDWKVGDRVVCIHDQWVGGGFFPAGCCPLRKGTVYTIRKFLIDGGYGIDGVARNKVCVILDEVSNPYGDQRGFDARRFRKVQPRKTSIEVFERILRDVTAKEDA